MNKKILLLFVFSLINFSLLYGEDKAEKLVRKSGSIYRMVNDKLIKLDKIVAGTDTVLKTKLFGLKVRHFNNSCLLIAFTRSIHALFSM